MKDKITLSCFISDEKGQLKIDYLDNNFKQQIDKFKDENKLEIITITFENANSPEHFLYKFYWGYLLPDLAFAMGEKNIHKVHVMAKKRFLLINVDSYEEIPKKYFSKGVYVIDFIDMENLDNIESHIKYIKGLILIKKDGALFAYIPSNATITHKEMKEYTENVEFWLYNDLDGRLGEEGRDPEQAQKLRAHGMDTLTPAMGGQDATQEEKLFEEKVEINW